MTVSVSMNFGQLFEKSLSNVQSEREESQRQLEKSCNENYEFYVSSLAKELCSSSQQDFIRSAAGIALKNAITAKDYNRKIQLHEKWIRLNHPSQEQIKSEILSTFDTKTSRQVATALAQAIATIAEIELPLRKWDQLIPLLVQNITNPNASSNLKKISLQALGFICEQIAPEILQPFADPVLTAVVQGIRDTDQAVQLDALTALYNSLEFISVNFSRQNERDFIMQVVCESTRSDKSEIVVSAFENLVKIMSLYYDSMALYMQHALFQLTIHGMKSDDEKVALQAIEFWSTVCDEEIALNDEAAEAMEYGEEPDRHSMNFAKAAISSIMPVLLQLLTKQSEEIDDDEWTISMASGTCLSLLAQTVENDIVPFVVPFVESNIQSPEWRLREASVMAFGSILEGPSSEILQPLVTQALPMITQMMQDPDIRVKDTSAWTLGRVSELHPECIKSEQSLNLLMTALLRGLEDTPRVSSNCCWAIMNMSDRLGDEERGVQTYPLSPYFEYICVNLIKTATRSDATEANLATAAYEALSNCLLKTSQDCMPIVLTSANAVLEQLEITIRMEPNLLGGDDRAAHAEVQTALCGVIQSFARKLGRDVLPIADRIMVAFFSIFQSSSKQATTIEDVFLAISVMINTMEGDFARYMETFVTFLYSALQNHEEHQLCSIAVGIVGDLCRALGENVLPYCDNFMNLLVQNLASNLLHRDVKPGILSCFGDIALAIQSKFDNYLNVAMTVLQQACQTPYDHNDADFVDYLNRLRECIIEALTGIVQGLKGDNAAHKLMPYVEFIFAFLQSLYGDEERSEEVTRGAIGLLGDLASALGPQVKPLLTNEWVEGYLKSAKSGRGVSQATKEVAKWANSLIKNIMGSA